MGFGLALVKITALTLFPEILRAFFESSIMAKAVQKGIISFSLVDIRDYALDKHKSCDDAVYGGGAGMLMLPEPLSRALESAGVKAKGERVEEDAGKRVVFPTPSGKPFSQADAWRLSAMDELVFVCGRYEGIDQRIADLYVDEELSIGDYVASSGELAALVIIDAACRLIPDVISGDSLKEESFSAGLLEYPQYTRPEMFKGMAVPEVLLSGHHENIRRWRLRKQVEKTLRVRPDLLAKGLGDGIYSGETVSLIKEIENGFDQNN